MSWTRSSGTRLRLRATPSGTVNYVLRQMFSPTMLQRSPLRKLPAVLMNTFFTFAYHIHKLITSDMQSHSQSQTLLIWSVSCISSAVQMVLICWLMFITAPVVQRLFELVAGACLNLYTVFGFLIETVLYYASLAIIVFIAAAGTFIVHRFFKVNWLRYLVIIWACAGGLRYVVLFCTATCGLLIKHLLSLVIWLCIPAGATMVVVLRFLTICLGGGSIIISVLSFHAAMYDIGNNRFDKCYGSLLQFDSQQPKETVRKMYICVFVIMW